MAADPPHVTSQRDPDRARENCGSTCPIAFIPDNQDSILKILLDFLVAHLTHIFIEVCQFFYVI